MIELNKIESKYFDLMGEKISIKEFEKWVYETKWLESELTEDEYIDLISLNYGTSSSKYEIGKILNERFDEGKFESVKMVELLTSIIERDGKEGESLTRMYDLYCRGYYFLEDLGLGIGLFIEVPNKYGVEYYHELNDSQKKELVNSVYPSAKEIAIELKNWILKGDLKLTGEREVELNRWQYIDNRTEEDKKSRVWKVEDVDSRTGEVRSKSNLLLNKNGDFKTSKEENDNWIKRIFKRKKPNR
jgi:hypothetical protein